MIQENWKIHPEYCDYEISDFGNVKSKKTGIFIKPRANEKGYLRVNLWKDEICKRIFVHKLVCETFIGPRPNGKIIRHYPDQNPSNNNLNNLSYDTPQQNNYDRIENNTYTCAKLTSEDVLEIKEALICGISGHILSKLYTISPAVITNIKHNKIWKNIGPDVSLYWNKYAKQPNSSLKLIFELNKAGFYHSEIAKLLGVTDSTVYKTLNGIHNK